MQILQDAIRKGSFLLDIEAHDVASILRITMDELVARKLFPAEHRQEIEAALLRRERLVTTAIGNAVAVPHAYSENLVDPLIVFVRLARPVNLGAPDGVPTRFLFVLLGPKHVATDHLDTLANIARLMSDDEFRYAAGRARNQDELLAAFDRFAQRYLPPEPTVPEVPSDGLEYTGRFLGGIMNDIRRRRPHYLSDFRDGLTAKTLSSSLFLFFACFAPAVTFGGIMGEQTGGQIGVVEMLVASAGCGVIYALFAGQPLIILGGVGPLLVFTAILYQLCQDWQVDFLPTYGWVGIWTALLLFLLAATDASCLMRYFTRFTDEIFSVLMAFIFIYEAVRAIVIIFRKSFAGESFSHDAAFLALILALGTYYIATSLTRFRRSRYLVPWMREFLADFGPMIALSLMTLVAWFYRDFVHTIELKVPDTLRTTAGRDWLVDLFAAPMWIRIVALGPAVLATLLIYLTQNITARLVNSPDHKLKKGPAYHLDLAIVGILVGVCSLFGLPWLVAASVRSLAHIRGLASTEDAVAPDGEKRERVTHVQENRVTGLVIHLLIAFSLLSLPALTVVPMAVLYGIFLFMGVVSLGGNQLMERMALWIMDSDLYPQTHYVRQVPNRVIHAYTLIQVACLAMLCVVTLSPYDVMRLTFPLFIALLVPVRFALEKLFSPGALAALDADETPEEEATHWSA